MVQMIDVRVTTARQLMHKSPEGRSNQEQSHRRSREQVRILNEVGTLMAASVWSLARCDIVKLSEKYIGWGVTFPPHKSVRLPKNFRISKRFIEKFIQLRHFFAAVSFFSQSHSKMGGGDNFFKTTLSSTLLLTSVA